MMKSNGLRGYSTKLFVIFLGVLLSAMATTAFATPPDIMPIPDDVVQSVREIIAKRRPDPTAERLRKHLDETSALLRETEKEEDSNKQTNSQNDGLNTERRAQFDANLSQLGALQEEVGSRLKAIRQNALDSNQPENVRQWESFALQVEERFERIRRVLKDLRGAGNGEAKKAAIAKAKKVLREVHESVKEREDLPNEPITTWRQENRPLRKPVREPAPLPAYAINQWQRNNVYAFLGDTLLAPPAITTEASTCGYTSADLGESQEVQLTSEIKVLAQKLEYSPVKIFQYVINEIRFEPYYGSLKGATGTLVSGAGNDTDQASLLIALLRASNIPARYVQGVPYFENDQRLLAWIGAKDYPAAVEIISQGRNPYIDFDQQSKVVVFDHVWVEACVPYGQYRGAYVNSVGYRWIPLDPSFKEKTYQNGIATNVAFDYNDYLQTRSDTLPVEYFETQIESIIKSLPPNYANNTLEDVPYKGKQIPRKMDVLPASLPYKVLQYKSWGSGIATSDTAEVPDAHRYKFNVALINPTTGNATFTTASLPQMALKRITLSFKGATTTDTTNLNAWLAGSDINAEPPSTIKVIPVIQPEGLPEIVGPSDTANYIPLTKTDLTLVLYVTLGSEMVNKVEYNNIAAANYYALQAYAFQASDRLLSERAANLLAWVRSISTPKNNFQLTIGEFLHLVGLKYMRYISDGAKRIAALDGGSGESGNHLGLTCVRMKVQYLFDLPFAINGAGFLIDVPGGISRSVDLKTGVPAWKTFLLSGYNMSAYESYIWQENARLDAVSSVRGIQFAKEKYAAGNTSYQVLTLTSANWLAEKGKLTNNTNYTAYNYSTSFVTSLYDDYISKGYTVTIPRRLLQYGNWKGYVYIAENPNAIDPDTGNAIYDSIFAISGQSTQSAGGYTVDTDPISEVVYDPTLDTGYVNASVTDPGSTTTEQEAVIYVGDGVVGQGDTNNNTYGGDPVNMVTGNMYHTERDLSIKGRGGMPIVFQRCYVPH